MKTIPLFWIIIVVSYFPLLNSGYASTEDGLVAYWAMDEIKDNMVKDRSGNGFDAVFKSRKKEVDPELVPGVHGNAIRFHQKQSAWLDVHHADKLFSEDHFTVMAWVKPQMSCNILSDGRVAPLVMFCRGSMFKEQGKGRHGWIIRYYKENMFFYHFQSRDENAGRLEGGSQAMPMDLWTHMIIVYSGNAIHLYIDGKKAAGVNTKGIFQIRNTPFIIGNYITNKTTFAFDGAIDEVKIFNKALSKSEIMTIREGLINENDESQE